MSILLNEDYFPYSVALEVTLACNMQCLHCGSSAGKVRANPLSLEEWFSVIEDLRELKAEIVTLSGGEPFVYPHWKELVLAISKKEKGKHSMNAAIISNGHNISDDDLQFLAKNKIVNLGISLDGTREIHDHIRQKPGSYDDVLKTLRRCHELSIPCGVITSVNRLNFPILDQLAQELSSMEKICWQVQIVNSFGRANDNRDDLLISHEQFATLVEKIEMWQKQYRGQMVIAPADSIGYHHHVCHGLLDGDLWQGCNAGKYSLGIESDGNVKGCLSLQDSIFIAGNIRERSLIDLWNDDDAFSYTRKPKPLEGNCKECSCESECLAGCLGIAYSIHQSIYENSYCYKSITENKKSACL